jgi:7-cyano-7-deazaguanine tRNA-ribosyltransferase
MSFELRDRDILGRIGRLKTKKGTIETPAFMPVVNPISQTISPKIMKEKFGCQIIITNAYIIKKHFEGMNLEIHDLLEYDGVITTDSGAYQILVYGEVDTSPNEIIEFQKKINSDIGVILDIPTGWNIPKSRVKWTVEETLRRAESSLPLIENSEALWVGPVQGGMHLDLVERAAKKIGQMPFQIHALGSPTEVMESYYYTILMDMILTAKLNLPSDRPFHLFGAGHPIMFSFAVALGCDLFDSASYALYAKDERYLTNRGTRRLKNINYLPCSCPVCRKFEADDLKDMVKGERVKNLTKHNLYVIISEIETIKQSISEGSLWELIEARCRTHPSLTSAFKKLEKYADIIEKKSPLYKGRGIFIYDSSSLVRPEITRYLRLLNSQYKPSVESKKMLMVPAPDRKPFTKTKQFSCLIMAINEVLKEEEKKFHLCFYSAPFGVIPIELSETYPLSQYEIAKPLGKPIIDFALEKIALYIEDSNHNEVILYAGKSELDEAVIKKCQKACSRKGKKFTFFSEEEPWKIDSLRNFLVQIREKSS